MNDLDFSIDYVQSLIDDIIGLKAGKRRSIKGYPIPGMVWEKKYAKLGLNVDVFYLEPKGKRGSALLSHGQKENGVVQVRGKRGNKKWKVTLICSEFDFPYSDEAGKSLLWITHQYNDGLYIVGTTINNNENLNSDITALRLFGVVSSQSS